MRRRCRSSTPGLRRQSGTARREVCAGASGKKRAILFSFVGIAFGLLVTLFFRSSGFWEGSFAAWGWLAAVAVLYHLALWLIPHLGWDARLRWDPRYFYLPWACAVVFFCLVVYLMPEARSLIPYGFLVSLLLLVGVAGFLDVLGFSVVMWGGYVGVVLLLIKQGEPLSLPQEASKAALFLAISLLAGLMLDRARRQRWELAGLRRRLTLAIRGSGAGWWDIPLDPGRPTQIPDEVHLSAELKALIGFEDDEFPNSLRAWHSRIPGRDADEIYSSAQHLLKGGAQLRETRYQIRHKNGELREIYSHSRIQRNSVGLPIRWSGLEWDVTERERDQQELRKLSRAVEQSPSLVIITDTKGRIEYVNPKFCRTTGYSAAEVTGKDPAMLRRGEADPDADEQMWSTIRAGGEWHGEFRNRQGEEEALPVVWILAGQNSGRRPPTSSPCRRT